MPNRRNIKTLALVAGLAAVLLASGVVLAQKTVPGEKWRMKMSMEMPGMSMPPTEREVCLPPGKPEESALKQDPNQRNCKVSNLQTSGNKTSADIQCSGEAAMEGRWEIEKQGDTMLGRMVAKTGGMSMTVKYEFRKLGGACQAVDYSAR